MIHGPIRRTTPLLLICLAAGLTATTCGSREPASKPDSGSVAPPVTHEITFAHPYQGVAAELLEELIGEFDAARDDVTVKIIRLDRPGLENKIEDSILGGKGPDLFVAGDAFAREWFEHKRIVEPLNRLLASGTATPGDRWLPRHVSRVRGSGLIWGVPLAVRVPLLISDPDNAGRQPGTRPEHVFDRERMLAVDVTDWRIVAAFLNAFGGPVVDAAGTPVMDSETSLKGSEFLRNQVATGAVLALESHKGPIDAFRAGEVSAAIVWPDQVSSIPASRSWIVMPMPEVAPGLRVTPWWETDTVFISSWSREKQLAAALLSWLTSSGSMATLAREGFPGLFVTTDQLPADYLSSPVSRGIRMHIAGSIPSPDFAAFGPIISIFSSTAMPAINDPATTADALRQTLLDTNTRARDTMEKIKQGQSIILR
ncbi:extracellular solute-binding protein [Myxococcota bacterium]|nr:extracellular solute-binding protein [Myxococcota bacterium]